MEGLIIKNKSNLYQIESKTDHSLYEAMARGKLKQDDISPVVGDVVEFTVTDGEKKSAVIEHILPRKMYSKRPKMANLTQLIFVVSSKDPKPDLLLLDKQLAFAEFLSVKAAIVLNKTDLDKKQEFKTIKEVYQKIGYPVIETEAKTSKNIDQVKQLLDHEITAFSGNSGVGKSTLMNAIFQQEVAEEGEVSNRNKRGKNTTTGTCLYSLGEGTYIADTPGFSTFEISEIPSQELAFFVKEFVSHISECEFVGCTHRKEQNCGIKQAVQKGEIDQGRYDRFCQIVQELEEKEKRKW